MTDCQRIDQSLAHDPATLDATLEAHLVSCHRCRRVKERLGVVLSTPRDATASRARPRWVWIGAAATLLLAAIVAPLVLRSHLSAPNVDEPSSPPVVDKKETLGATNEDGRRNRAAPEPPEAEPPPGEETGPRTAETEAAPREASPAPRASHPMSASRDGAGTTARGDDLDALLSGAVGSRSVADDDMLASDGPLPETLTRSQIQKGIAKALPDVASCDASYRVTGVVTIDIEIANDGRVRSAKAIGKFAGTPLGECIVKAVRSAKFPKFSGPSVTIQYPFVLRNGGGGSPPANLDHERSDRLGVPHEEFEEGGASDPAVLKLDTFARRSRRPLPPPTQSALALYAGLDRSRARAGGDTMVLQVALRATDRAPRPDRLNLVLALDVSGSMADEKLEYTKRAALESIRALGKRDRVAVVAYADRPRVIVPAGPPDAEDAEARFLFLSAGGRTNIRAALVRAYDVASRVHRAGDSTRVLLLSDGQVTSGVADVTTFHANARAAFQAGISTTTIGVGMAHADELMAIIARAGNGGYHFLMDPREIAATMRAEIDSLARAVASAILVRVALADGVSAQRVLGHRVLAQRASMKNGSGESAPESWGEGQPWIAGGIGANRGSWLKTTVPHFFASASYVSMIEVEVPPGTGRRGIADVSVRYRDLSVGHYITHKRTLAVDYTHDLADAMRSFDPTVHKNVIAFHIAEALRAAADDVEIGRTDRAARRVREQHRVVLAAARRFEDEGLSRDAGILARYRDALANLSDDRVRRYVALTFRGSADILAR